MIVQEYEINLNYKKRLPRAGDVVVVGHCMKGILAEISGTAPVRGRFILFNQMDLDPAVFGKSKPVILRTSVPEAEITELVHRLRKEHADLDAILRNVEQGILAMPTN